MLATTAPAASKRTFRVMGSDAELIVVGSEERDRCDLLDDAEAHLEVLEQRWSRFLPDSDLGRLNRAAGDAVVVDASTIELVEHLVLAHRATGGAFDPTLLPALVALGYAASLDDPNRRTSLPGDARPGCDVEEVHVDRQHRVVRLPPGTTLDGGGLAKGLAADVTVERLLAHGAAGALVGVGGDLRVAGRPPTGTGWLVAVADPLGDHDEVARVHLAAGAVATSSTLVRTWHIGGSRRHHLIDPVTTRPVDTGIVAATVVAGTAAWAEAWTKALMVGGASPTLARLDELGLAGLAVTTGHEVITNAAWKALAG